MQTSQTRDSNSRVVSGMAALLYSQFVTIFTQFASLPIFLLRWTPTQYGMWVVISAIPIYLTIADAGVLTASANLMSMHRAREEIEEVRRVFKATLLVILILVTVVAVIVGLGLYFFTFGMTEDQRGALFALTLASLLTIASGLFDAAYRPFGKYAKVVHLLNIARLLDWAGMICAVLLGYALTGVAVGFLVGRGVAFIAMYYLATRDVPEIEWKLDGIKVELVKELVRMGGGFISFTIGSLFTLQGMLILVGAQLGGGAVAVFSTSRTLTRLLAQISVLSGKSVAPELAAMYGAKSAHQMSRLSKQMVRIVMSVTVLGAVFLAFFGPKILNLWSRGKLEFDPPVFYVLLGAAVTTAYWQIEAVRLTATNRHQFLAGVFLISSVLAIVFAYIAMPHIGLLAAAVGTLGTDVIMVCGCGVALSRSRLFV